MNGRGITLCILTVGDVDCNNDFAFQCVGVHMLFDIVQLVMIIDLIVFWSTGYKTGTRLMQYPLMVTSIVRPFILVEFYFCDCICDSCAPFFKIWTKLSMWFVIVTAAGGV